MKKVKLSKTLRTFLLLLILISLVSVGVFPQNDPSAEKCEAEKAWEALIKTKGGREKLHSVTNMLVEYRDDKNQRSINTNLDIFPNKRWTFHYLFFDLPQVCAASDTTYPDTCGDENGLQGTSVNPYKNWVEQNRLPFLLETKWDKPEPLRVFRIREKKKDFDVIETRINNMRMDYVYEPEEMLVTEIHFYEDGKIWSKYRLYDYTRINGIMMPQRLARGSSLFKFSDLKVVIPIRFTLNVDYDPQIFERPLKATTPDAWKRKN